MTRRSTLSVAIMSAVPGEPADPPHRSGDGRTADVGCHTGVIDGRSSVRAGTMSVHSSGGPG